MSGESSGIWLRVLVLEDDLLIAMDVQAMLSDLDCIVLGPVPTVGQALSLVGLDKPDFAILDVHLGTERSTPVAEALVACGVPFALSTGYERAQLPERVLQEAPNLGKPLDRQLLRRTLAELRRGLGGREDTAQPSDPNGGKM